MLALVVVPAAWAQLIRMKGEGSLEHLESEAAAPGFLPGWAEVRFDFRLAEVDGDGWTSYAASSAVLRIGDERFELQNAALEVWRGESGWGPWTSYLLRGETAEGWWFSLQNDFRGGAEERGFPRWLAEPGELTVHDVLLRAGDFSWAGYGDGVITSIEVVPAPEPSTYAAWGAGVLGVSVLLRLRGRHRRGNRDRCVGKGV